MAVDRGRCLLLGLAPGEQVMGDLSEHFSRDEFICKCGCGQNTVDYALVILLEKIRAHFDVPVWITSGSRCRQHNTVVGGSEHSQHIYGRAADIVVDGIPPHLVAELADQLDAAGVGDYRDFTHVDTRNGFGRW